MYSTMRALSMILLLAVPATVSACEGDCIVGITNAWVSNYTMFPIQAAMSNAARQISDLIPSHPSVETVLNNYLAPITTAYKKEAYDSMEQAIFPSYFHGKCLDENGYEPEGCPNPDCPIVCGTPGSLIHFYPKLRFIAFNSTYHLLEKHTTPGAPAYKELERKVMDAANSPPPDERRRSYSRVFPRNLLKGFSVAQNNAGSRSGTGLLELASSHPPSSGSVAQPAAAYAPPSGTTPPASDSVVDSSSATSGSRSSGLLSGGKFNKALAGSSPPLIPGLPLGRRAQDVKSGLKSIMAQMHPLLEEACGGSGEESTNGLRDCSWEEAMKTYILSFP